MIWNCGRDGKGDFFAHEILLSPSSKVSDPENTHSPKRKLLPVTPVLKEAEAGEHRFVAILGYKVRLYLKKSKKERWGRKEEEKERARSPEHPWVDSD